MDQNNSSRLTNTLRNFRFGLAAQLVVTLLGFLSRTVFMRVLGEEYLGINGLYTSILDVLSLTELGLADVVIFSLYKPLAEDDTEKLTALMGYYKVIYRIIALTVGVIGVALVPLLTVLKELVRDRKIAVLVSLHELELAERVSDTVVCVAGNRIDRVGPPAEIFTSAYIAQLYHMEKGKYDPCFDSLEYVPH